MNFSIRHSFSDWPNSSIPMVSAGVYAIWDKQELVYCGMSGRDIENARLQGKKKYGLVTRLHSHASGRLSGDQFCVYVANRLVIPSLKPEDLPKFQSGELKLDALTKNYILRHFEYQYCLLATSKEARRGTLFDKKPLLNPL